MFVMNNLDAKGQNSRSHHLKSLNLGNLDKNQKSKITFKTNISQTPKQNSENKNKYAFLKQATNVAGVAAWLFIVLGSIKKLRLLEPKSNERISEVSKDLIKIVKTIRESAGSSNKDEIDNLLKGQSFKGFRKVYYAIGEHVQKFKNKHGNELFNNLTYAFGTLVVMPLVVLFSPFGKKDSSKEDKFFAVLRQPLSVLATFGMQFTFDKLIGKYIPRVLEQNGLEDSSILDQDGKIIKDKDGKISHDVWSRIKYNNIEATDGFKQLAESVLTPDEIQGMFGLASYEEKSASVYGYRLMEIIKKKTPKIGEKLKFDGSMDALKGFEDLTGEHANIKQLLQDFNEFAVKLNNNKIAIQKTKVWVNILFASIIGCTFLNVIYGKTMKALKNSNFFNMLVGKKEPLREAKQSPSDKLSKKEVK